MENSKIILCLTGFVAFAGYACIVDAYTNSSAYNEKAFDQAVLEYDSATRKADKLQALSIIKNLDMQAYGPNVTGKLSEFHTCMYRATLKAPTMAQYKNVFEGCI